MRSAKKETKAKTSKFFKMKDVRQKSRKERTLRALRRRSEVARARGVISSIVITGAVFSVILAIFAGNMITIKNPERFNYYETRVYTTYGGGENTKKVYVKKDPNDFNWEIFFLTFFVAFVPVVVSSWASHTVIDCVAGVSKDEEGDRMLLEYDQKERVRHAEMEKAVQKRLSAEEERQLEESKKATNALLDELAKDDDETENTEEKKDDNA